jgi:hypothetical protein
MNTPDKEAARAADDAALAAAEALIAAGIWGRSFKESVAIARRALRENRELRETLERVKAIRCEEHGIDEESWCYGCGVVDQINKRTRAAIADAASAPALCVRCDHALDLHYTATQGQTMTRICRTQNCSCTREIGDAK